MLVRTVQARLRVEYWGTVGGGQLTIRVLGLVLVNHRDSGLSHRPGYGYGGQGSVVY